MLLADEVFEHDGFQDGTLGVGVPESPAGSGDVGGGIAGFAETWHKVGTIATFAVI